MVFVIPMAGCGKRFFENGYVLPKFMVEVKNKTLFEYSVFSLPLEIACKLIFVVLEEHNRKYDVSGFIKRIIPDRYKVEIVCLESPTQGQAETVLKTKDRVILEEDLVIYNIDTYFFSKSLSKKLTDPSCKKDGILGAFMLSNDDDKWSFARVEDNKVVQTTEKERISPYALTGLYHFTKAGYFFDVAEKWIDEGRKVKNEFYIAPMYNDLIKDNKHFVIDLVDEFVALGTPDDVNKFSRV